MDLFFLFANVLISNLDWIILVLLIFLYVIKQQKETINFNWIFSETIWFGVFNLRMCLNSFMKKI